jgi:uncharacterized membrane protein (UPF0127 family)
MKKMYLKPLISEREQAKGFQFCKTPPSVNKGLLFQYECEKPMSFHMKNVCFDLDIIFLDKNKCVVDFFTMKANSDQTYSPKCNAQYAIELPKGALKEFQIRKDKRLHF